MNADIYDSVLKDIDAFNLPAYTEIPNIGLFLDQVVKYIAEYMVPLGPMALTGSMISNYVKKDIIKNPVKKQYNREQIAYLLFISIAKTVLSLEDIQLMITLQMQTYACENAYEYFRREIKSVLSDVFCYREPSASTDIDSKEKLLLHNMVIAVAHKVYLDKTLRILREN